MLKHLALHDFRNHKIFNLDFGGLTILIGPNGAGKTNIVEAIRLLSLGKSFKARQQQEMIRWGAQVARVEGKTDDQKIEVALFQKEKRIKINGVQKHAGDLLGLLPTVLFSPEDVGMLSGAPTIRRRFLNTILVQGDKKYLFALSTYQQLIRQRNASLQAIAAGQSHEQRLAVWDSQLIEQADILHTKRRLLVDDFNNSLPSIHKKATGAAKILNLQVKWSAITLERLTQCLGRDIALQSTTIGPHHDDFSLLLDGKDIGRFGSRGENRTVVVSLKIAELNYLGRGALLLLDDIFSELDHNRRERLQELIYSYQTVITTTDEHYISTDLAKSATIVKLT